jgi:hypothetical protein
VFDSSIGRALVVAARSRSRNVRSKSVNRLHHWQRVAVALSSALVFAAMSVTPTAGADTSQCAKFYPPPEPLPASTDGDVIRSESSRLVFEPSGQIGGFVADGTRIRYRSTDDHGEPIAIMATYLKLHNPWPGQDARPLIVFGTNSYGTGDKCAASKMFNQSVHWGGGADLTMGYEETFVATMVAPGFAVAITDYQGIGTPSALTLLIRQSQAHAILDAARAGMRLHRTSLDPHGPVAFPGYGQGGAASAAAVELAPSYAPDLHVVGAHAGAPPADLTLFTPYIDGSIYAGGVRFLLNGIAAADPEIRDGLLSSVTEAEKNLFNRSADECFDENVMRLGFRHVQQYFVSPMEEAIANEPLRSIYEAQRIGRLTPAAPVSVDSKRYDAFIPWGGARELALDWCAQGADVQFRTNDQAAFMNKTAPNNLSTNFVDGERAMQWVADRSNGMPTASNCAEM